jgi:acid phosphatase
MAGPAAIVVLTLVGIAIAVTLVRPSTPLPSPLATATQTPLLAATNTPAPGPTSTPAPTLVPTAQSTATPAPATAVDHVFVIVMENHAYRQVWNNSATPYTTSLANANARAANYFAISHPSLPNYLELFAGSNHGITINCDPSSTCHSNATNLADNLEAAGLTWKGYFEDMPAACHLTDSAGYRAHHNPFIYFDNIRTDAARCGAKVVNYRALSGDLATAASTPTYSMIVPNNCHNTHDCSVATGDAWLAANVPPLLTSPACVADSCLVVITWDEDDGSQGNHVLTVFAGSAARSAQISTARYDHFSLLRTFEDLLGVTSQTANDRSATPMSDLLR